MDLTKLFPQMVRVVMCFNERVSDVGTSIILQTRLTGRRVAAIQYFVDFQCQ